MKNNQLLIFLLITCLTLNACKEDKKWKPFGIMHSLTGEATVPVNQTFSSDTILMPFSDTISNIYALNLTATINLIDETSRFQALLVDYNGKHYLIFESYIALDHEKLLNVKEIAEETAYMKKVKPVKIMLIVRNAEVSIDQFKFYTEDKSLAEERPAAEDIKLAHDSIKLEKVKDFILKNGLNWKANHTGLSKMSFHERKTKMGDVVFPGGLEFYTGGVFQSYSKLPDAEKSEMVEAWDWRDRHGTNWITSIKQQGSCGSCWIYSNLGVTEALVNLYYNDKIDLDLSEQNVLSCTDIPWGGCKFGIPEVALDYIKEHGVVDENSFPYADIITECQDIESPKELIKITDYKHFSTFQLDDVDKLKQTIIKYGPVGECVFYNKKLKDQVHVMANIGWSTDKDNHTIWIFKSSWGKDWGEDGFLYTKLYFPFQTGFIYHQVGPIESLVVERKVKCTDNDGDGYYFWGLGEKPKYCPKCPDEPDGDDSNPKLGPLDLNGRCKAI